MTTITHKSKVSNWLIVFVFIACYIQVALSLILGEFSKTTGIIAIVITPFFVVIIYTLFRTFYIIEDEKLIIKYGPFTHKPIHIQEIKSISTTTSKITAPAPSFDRIEIKYGKFDEVIISPEDKIKFTEELIKINPNIKSNISKA